MAVKRQFTRRPSSGKMARPTGPSSRPPRRRFFRTRRRIGWGWVRQLPLLWLGAVAVCLALLYFIAASGYFSVRTVEAPTLAPREMAEVIARCECMGKNIFTVRPDDVKRRLEGIPTLIVARVFTTLPNHLHVEATYRRRVAIWRTPEAAYAVGANAEVLQVWRSPFRRNQWKPLPIFDEGYDSSLKKGHRLLVGEHIPAAGLAMALSLRSRIPSQLQTMVKGYSYRPIVGVTMIGKTNWWALFGLDSSTKLDQRAGIVLAAATGAKPALRPGGCIDLRATYYIRHDHRCA